MPPSRSTLQRSIERSRIRRSPASGIHRRRPGAALDWVVTQQAQIIAYLDDYKLLLVATLAVLPLLAVFKRPASPGAGDTVVMD
jgi:hypothetical protein